MPSKLIYTLTFHEVLNVGATLQAYGLQRFLLNEGFESEIINYRPRYFLWQIYRPAKTVSRSVIKMRQLFKFARFRRRHLRITRRSIYSINGLTQFSDCLAIICGSDQVWNRRLTGGSYDPVFFLGTPLACQKIAFGASAGGHKLSPDRTTLVPMLKDFASIGVREDALRRDLVDSGMVSKAETVLDPTFLIRDWSSVIDRRYVPKDMKYIASYEVSDDATRADFERKVGEIKARLGLPVIHLGAKPITHADLTINILSPGEWLGLLESAYLVCTNSFHGVALSVNLGRGLIFIPHLDAEKNVRALGLLARTGLDRLTYSGADSDLNRHSDYPQVQLEAQILASQSFIREALT